MRSVADPTASQSRQLPGWRAWALHAPLLAWLAAFVVVPTGILLVYSVLQNAGNGEVERTFTWANYRLTVAPVYLRVIGRSLGYAALTTAPCAIVGYPVAYYIGRATARRRSRLLMAVMIPFWTSFLIRTFAWKMILDQHGVLNAVLRALHIIPAILGEDFEVLYTPAAVLIALVYTYLPFMILPIYGSVEKLDDTLIEAASDLGAGPARAFWRVTLPLTMPGVGAGALMVFVPAVAMFAVTTVMSGGKIRLIGDVIQDQFSQAGNVPFGSALGMVLLGMFIVSYYAFARRAEVRR